MDAAPTPTPPTPTALPSTATDASDARVNVDAVARATMDTVARKMSDARALLAVSASLSESHELLAFIEMCASTIKTLRETPPSRG